MGFDCGCEAVKKFKDYTLADYDYVRAYISWRNNPWMHDENGGNCLTFEDYLSKYGFSTAPAYHGEPDQELIDFYDHDANHVEVFSWGSRSIQDFDEYFIEHLKRIDDGEEFRYWVTRDSLTVLNEYINSHRKDDINSVRVIKSINTKDDPEDEEKTIEVLREIDGVVARIYNDYTESNKEVSVYSEYDDGLLYVDNIDDYYILRGLESFSDKLSVIDFNDYWIYYWRGW